MAAVHDAQVPTAVHACSYDAACLVVSEQQNGYTSPAVDRQGPALRL